MTPQMLEILYQLSLCHDTDPEVVFQQVVRSISDYYGDTMAMINLTEGNCIAFRAVVNPHRVFARIDALELQHTYCQFALRTVCPLLIQNAAQHPDFANHPGVRFGLTRYLGVPIRNPNGDPIGTLCFLDDRTEEVLGEEDARFLSLLAMRVSAEVERERSIQARVEEHRHMAEQHRHMAEQLAEANAQMEAAAEEMRRFVAMIVHDLRHPLTALKTVLYLLRDETDPEQRAHSIAMLENRVQALANLLDGLREYNEIEAGRARLNITQVDLQALIAECVDIFGPAFVSDQVTFRCEIASNLGTGRTDGGKLTHILLNLLSNALKFTPRGTVWVRARRQGAGKWMLEVEDTGIGMSAEVQQRVFEEFYRVASPELGAVPTERRGSGLGLAIVKRLCEALQATIHLESAPGRGTKFRLTFSRHLQSTD